MATSAAQTKSLVIGSRGSQLALWQARHIATKLITFGIETRIEIIRTTGDHLRTASLVQAGGKGLFTKEIEEALLAGTIDVAVHSLKDLPTDTPHGLTIAAIPEREDARDALVGQSLEQLRPESRVGTSSNRRAAQLRCLCPGIQVENIRGNVDTRIRKVKEGQFEAIVLALAGLRRLGLEREVARVFSPKEICPAPGQGALAIETRENDPARDLCVQLNDEPTAQAVRCERAVLAALGGGCQLAIGAFARAIADNLEAIAVVASPEGRHHLYMTRVGPRDRPEDLGRSLADDLLIRGAARILAESR